MVERELAIHSVMASENEAGATSRKQGDIL
jgi:hypothetical protein